MVLISKMDKLPRFLRYSFAENSRIRRFSRATQDTKDLYAILEVPKKATHSDIKQAYYNLTMKYHPDRNENCPEAAVKFREVTEAYEILGTTSTRERYDLGGMSFVESTIPQARKAPIQHDVQHRAFFDRRNELNQKKRTALGDTSDQMPWKSRVDKPPQEYSNPEEKVFHDRLKMLAFIVFVILIVCRNRSEQT